MPFSPATLEEKPYNACVNCQHIGVRCDGPNFLAMTAERWCEWCRLRKDFLDLSNADLVEKSGVSKNTIDRVMTGAAVGISAETLRAVTKALVAGTWGQYPCAMASTSETVSVECEHLKEQAEEDKRKIAFLREQITFKENQMVAKDKLLDERRDFLYQKDRTISMQRIAIVVLAVILGACVAAIIAALVIDKGSTDMGFFWR